MKEHDDKPDIFETIKKLIESNSDFQPEQLTGPLFVQRLVGNIRFWCEIGRPNKETMDRLAVWVKLQQDRELTAFLFDLAGREAVRQLILKLERNYHKNTSPAPPRNNRDSAAAPPDQKPHTC